jgi:hypothetical protein
MNPSNEKKGLPLPMEVGLVIIPSVILVISIYFWTAWSNGANPVSISNSYYPLLARGLVNHHLYLDIEPRRELLELANPYDPVLNESYRLHDASLYHGKYYLYFGPTPAICLFVPYFLLTGHDFPQKIAVPLFCSAGFLFSVLLFLLVLSNTFRETSLWLKYGCLLSLGLANICPFLIRRPDVYEVAIACAFTFLQLGFLLFYLAMRNAERSLLWLVLASSSLGASVGARPNCVLAGGVFCALAIVLAGKRPLVDRGWPVRPPGKSKWAVVCSIGPMVLTGLLVAWYNAARFGNPLEFGQRYQLAGVEMGSFSFFQLDNFAYDMWYNFFSPVSYRPEFPFVDAVQPKMFSSHQYGLEKVAGMFLVSPVTIFSLAFPVLYARHAIRGWDRALLVTLILMAGSVVAIVCPLLFVSGATMRYLVDFVPTVVILGCLMLCHFDCCCNRKSRRKRWLFNGFVVMILLVSCADGLFLSFTGYSNLFQVGDPAGYAAVAKFFQPFEFLFEAIHGLFS